MRMNHSPERCDEVAERVAPGKCHVELIEAADCDVDTDKPYTQFRLQVRAHPDPDQVNRVHSERCYWYHEKETVERMNQEKICLFGIRCGLTTKDELAAKHANNEEVSFDWDSVIGTQLIVEIQERKGANDKVYSQIKQGAVWEPDDPAVADVPKDEQALAVAQAEGVF